MAVLISKMPRMRPELGSGRLGECYRAKPDFIKVYFGLPKMNSLDFGIFLLFLFVFISFS